MVNLEDLSIVNIRDLDNDTLREVLSDFSCYINSDVEKFIKCNSIDFAKKNQSVTYLVVSNELEVLGYFTLTIKPIKVSAKKFSNSINRKISRVSDLDVENNEYNLSAYLIAQLGKNYSHDYNYKITGNQLLTLALNTIKELQYQLGGMVVFLETENNSKLLTFYQDNGFKIFNAKQSNAKDKHSLVQLLKIL